MQNNLIFTLANVHNIGMQVLLLLYITPCNACIMLLCHALLPIVPCHPVHTIFLLFCSFCSLVGLLLSHSKLVAASCNQSRTFLSLN